LAIHDVAVAANVGGANMITRRHLLAASAASLCSSFIVAHASAETPAARVTVLYDAFGKPSPLKTGWGYASLIEYGGRRILFDTGGNGADFAHNVNTLGIDLKNLDFVVLSHRHNDHTAGLTHVLQENASVPVYTPVEGAGFNAPLSAPLMNMLRRPIASLPEELRYYGGNLPAEIRSEPPWPAHFIQITATKEVLPGFFLFSTRSETPGTREMNEVSLVIKTPKGSVLIVGCSHPGIETIVEAAAKIDPQIYSVFGGFHLVDVPDITVTEMLTRFRDKWRIERIAAGHCTGQFAFTEMIRIFGANFDHAGVGSVIALPS
jgi:7,8-dihydropterin-6-yl-methyl-4-(beta-D-ribofuranosyl)aminobenzene 5'-phosphate synthase